MTARSWLGDELDGLAAERILDAAGALFAAQGVAGTTMGDVAAAAGCSRATLYRYYDNRDALRAAFVQREARRIGRAVAGDVAGVTDPADRVVEAMVAALRRVRRDPALAAWFDPADAGIAARLARSAAIEAMVAAFVGDPADPAVAARARWIVRVIVSLLTQPGEGEQDERAMLRDFVAPVVVAPRSRAGTRQAATTRSPARS